MKHDYVSCIYCVINGGNANTLNFSFCHRYARGLNSTIGILPPLRGSDINSMLPVGCVRAFGARFTHVWGPVAPMGLKSGVLPSRPCQGLPPALSIFYKDPSPSISVDQLNFFNVELQRHRTVELRSL